MSPGPVLDPATLEELRRLARSRPRSGRQSVAKASAIRTLERLARERRKQPVPPMPEGWYPHEPDHPFFDSRTPIDTGRGVYLEAEANEVVDDAQVERIMAIFSERSVAQGGSAWTAAEVRAPADLRPYRATVLKAFLGVNDRRTEVRLSH